MAALEDLLQDKDLYKNLVKGTKSTRICLTPRVVPANPKLTPSRSLQPSRTVDSTLLTVWSKDLSKFWESPNLELKPNGELAQFYDGMVLLQKRHSIDAVRR